MPITLLKKGQEIELVATAKIGMGITHVKHTPGLLHYREFYEATAKKGKAVDKEFINEFPNLMISMNEEGNEAEFERHKLQNGKTFGEALADALRMWLEHKWPIKKKKMTLLESRRLGFHSGIRDLSKRVDELVYKR